MREPVIVAVQQLEEIAGWCRKLKAIGNSLDRQNHGRGLKYRAEIEEVAVISNALVHKTDFLLDFLRNYRSRREVS